MQDVDLSEKRFEEDIENYLITEGGFDQLSKVDPEKGRHRVTPYYYNWDIYPCIFLDFLEKTQPNCWKKLKQQKGNEAGNYICDCLVREINNKGLIYVLKNGFKDYIAGHVKVCFFKPESELNETSNKLYEQNIFGVDRQFHYSDKEEPKNTLDMAISLNGIPIISLELKNQFKVQTYENAIEQYQTDRNPKVPCFRFDRRFIVYFAVDIDEVWVSTKLDGAKTKFVPFNQGSNGAGNAGGKGNPDNSYSDKYRTSYLWENILSKDSIMKLLEKYITRVSITKDVNDHGRNKKVTEDEIIFPRYHQLDVIDKIVDDVKQKGAGQNYLIEHSAGSGKSNSIAWLAYQLESLHDLNNNFIFDSVIVITNRIVLDNQLQETIMSFNQTEGLVETIGQKGKDKGEKRYMSGSERLKNAINDGKKIIICTIQKFLYCYKDIDHSEGKKYAIIVDEAHQGQTGESASSLRKALMDYNLELEKFANEEGVDVETLEAYSKNILEALMSQGKHENQSFFAFTATPKNKTLEWFGVRDEINNIYYPFHTYSMRQAIEEGYILDVLQNYTTIQQAFEFIKTTESNPQLVESDATKALIEYYKCNDLIIENKVELIMSNFLNNGRFKINGQGKAMVVTSSRKEAVLYFLAIKDFIKNHPNECKGTDVLVAFTGEVHIDGNIYTEASLNIDDDGNGISNDKKFRKLFRSPRYNILVVADKYQMGFDEPLLHSMYIDKVLKDVSAVQTISRLNRSCPGKEDTFVLDFANTSDDIRNAFQTYYEDTHLNGSTYINKVYDIQKEIAKYFIYDQEDCDKYYDYLEKHKNDKNVIGGLRNRLSEAIQNYNNLEDEEEKSTLRALLFSFVSAYDYVTSLVPIHDVSLFKESTFVSALTKFLPRNIRSKIDLDNEVALKYAGLIQTYNGAITLEKKSVDLLPSSMSKKKRISKKDTLQSIIDKLNEIFGSAVSDGDRVVVSNVLYKLMSSSELSKLKKAAKNRNKEMFIKVYFHELFSNIVRQCYEENDESYMKLITNNDFCEKVEFVTGESIYEELRSGNDDDDEYEENPGK